MCVCMLESFDTLTDMQLSITLLSLLVSTLKLSFCRQCACILPSCHRSTGLSLLPLCHRCAHSSSDIHSVASAHSAYPLVTSLQGRYCCPCIACVHTSDVPLLPLHAIYPYFTSLQGCHYVSGTHSNYYYFFFCHQCTCCLPPCHGSSGLSPLSLCQLKCPLCLCALCLPRCHWFTGLSLCAPSNCPSVATVHATYPLVNVAQSCYCCPLCIYRLSLCHRCGRFHSGVHSVARLHSADTFVTGLEGSYCCPCIAGMHTL